MTTQQRNDVIRIKQLLSKHPKGCLLSDKEILALVHQVDELVEIPTFVDEYLRKKRARSLQDDRKLKQLKAKKKLTTSEWKELELLLNRVWPTGS